MASPTADATTAAVKACPYTVTVIGAEEQNPGSLGSAKPSKNKNVVYKLQVIVEATTWFIYRNMKAFSEFHDKLKHKYGSSVVPSRFPSTKSGLRGILSPIVLNQQHMALQTWIQKVLKTPQLASSPELKSFLETDKRNVDIIAIAYEEGKIKPGIEQMGYLYYMTRGRWTKRWFVLRNHILYKYKSPMEKNPYRSYNWEGATAMATLKADIHAFVVTDINKRRFYFAAESEAELEQWIDAVVSETNEEQPPEASRHVFGVPLEKIPEIDENGLPLLMTALIRYIEHTGLDTEDLFSKPPDPALKKKIEAGELDFELIQNVHSVAGLLQIFLKELPEPLLTFELHNCFIGVADIAHEQTQRQVLRTLVEALPPLHVLALCRMLKFLYLATRGYVNRLDRLARIFAPLFLRRKMSSSTNVSVATLEAEQAAGAKILKVMIEKYWLLFKGEDDMPDEVWDEFLPHSPRLEKGESMREIEAHPRQAAVVSAGSTPVPPLLKSISYAETKDLEDEIKALEEKKKALEDKKKNTNEKTDLAAQAQVKTRKFTESRIGGLDSEMQLLERRLEEKRKKLNDLRKVAIAKAEEAQPASPRTKSPRSPRQQSQQQAVASPRSPRHHHHHHHREGQGSEIRADSVKLEKEKKRKKKDTKKKHHHDKTKETGAVEAKAPSLESKPSTESIKIPSAALEATSTKSGSKIETTVAPTTTTASSGSKVVETQQPASVEPVATASSQQPQPQPSVGSKIASGEAPKPETPEVESQPSAPETGSKIESQTSVVVPEPVAAEVQPSVSEPQPQQKTESVKIETKLEPTPSEPEPTKVEVKVEEPPTPAPAPVPEPIQPPVQAQKEVEKEEVKSKPQELQEEPPKAIKAPEPAKTVEPEPQQLKEEAIEVPKTKEVATKPTGLSLDLKAVTETPATSASSVSPTSETKPTTTKSEKGLPALAIPTEEATAATATSDAHELDNTLISPRLNHPTLHRTSVMTGTGPRRRLPTTRPGTIMIDVTTTTENATIREEEAPPQRKSVMGGPKVGMFGPQMVLMADLQAALKVRGKK
eukprot:TRINITY_DN1358_c0_g1_i1.p1 TRINITY_DN1358_c0_g1~~TRINITY_DN1358_c0_g1_i1.p1  ORF type:complete len:1053 (-),score=361.84 TRINITY_DN1358_c0_g1_i1:129-3287(-)